MKRDLDLIREILLEVQADRDPLAIQSQPEEIVRGHCVIAIEAGLLIGRLQPVPETLSRFPIAIVQRLSWAGHDFLGPASNPSRWERVKTLLAKVGGDWTLDLVKDLLTNEMVHHLER